MTTLDADPTIDALLVQLGPLALLPEVTRRVIAVVDDPGSSSDDLRRVVDSDPVLAGRLVQIANSPLYGFSSQVASTRRAIELLGYEATRSVAVVAAMATLRRVARGVPGFGAEQWWAHAGAVAVAARGLASASKAAERDEAFLAGLVHDLGFLVFMVVDPTRFAQLDRRLRDGEEQLAAERATFGVSHDRVGAALCASWRFPDRIRDAVRFHHGGAPADRGALPRLVEAAEGLVGELHPDPASTGPSAALDDLGLDAREIERIRQLVEASTSGALS